MKKTKKLLLLMAVIVTALVCFALSASALDATGQCGDNVYWEYNSTTGELVISGTGPMWENVNGKVSPFNNKHYDTVVIGNGVTSIGFGSFIRCSFDKLILGKDIKTVYDHAFSDCSIEVVYFAGTSEQWDEIYITNVNNQILKKSIKIYGYCIESRSFDHVNKLIYNQVSSTCILSGYTSGVYCPDCEEWLSGHEVISAKGHTDADSDKFCDDCGNYTAKLYKSGSCGDNVTYEWYEDGMVIISGTGAMTDYENYNGSPFYISNIKSVVINEGVTTIGDWAFYYCKSLTEVTIPDSVTTIGDWAFYSCGSLTEVTIGDSVTTIGDYAFYWCNSLTEATIGDSVTTIGDEAFFECYRLTEVTIPDSVTTIGDSAFRFCDSLTEVTIGNSVTTIGDSAFEYCYRLTEVTIGDSVTTIGNRAFYSCDSLTEVTIPDSVKTIGYGAFAEDSLGRSGLTKVTIGDSVTTIGNYAFEYCDSLTEVTIGGSVTTIGEGAFRFCGLTEVTIGDSVTTIGKGAFYGCDSLTDVYYSGTKEQWKKISIGLVNSDLTGANIHYNYCPHTDKTSYPQQNPTCTEIGYTAGVYCNICQRWSDGHEKINAKGHSYTEKIIDSKHLKSKATVEKSAVYKYDCANCDSISPDKTFTYGNTLALGVTSSVTSAQTVSSITLTWSKAANATGYRLYYKLPGDISWRNAVTYTTATTCTFNKLPAGQKYTFAVRSAYKKADGSYILGGYKAIETATKAVNPKEITVTQNTSAIRLSWNLCAGATGYKVYQKVDGEWKALKVVASTTYTIQGLKAGTKYTFAVKPYIKTDSGNIWSSYTEFTTATKPATPSTKLTSLSKGNISLTFGAVNGADGYRVYYKTGNGAYKLYNTYTKAGTLNFSNLKSGTKYTFAVRAGIKTSGGVVWSGYNEAAVTVK